ncbi:hypothetical protein GL263_27745 [Streptomyces durbertensis]|uniref:Uncharacterized protein n=1 Tax=Streptomyces durbertensis TaxID=2448886 RepID=A0ABR6EPN8_9ACTN|nr:hypothetical protein [Streptomyces durbertensis]MBB1247309.1 hypothetical protein [Streptomyces durbertensis]
MRTSRRPAEPTRPRVHDVNARIRRLMDEPADERRAAEYIRLLQLWAEATGTGLRSTPSGSTSTPQPRTAAPVGPVRRGRARQAGAPRLAAPARPAGRPTRASLTRVA